MNTNNTLHNTRVNHMHHKKTQTRKVECTEERQRREFVAERETWNSEMMLKQMEYLKDLVKDSRKELM